MVVNPYISQLSPIFREAVQGDYLIKRKDGSPWQLVFPCLLQTSQKAHFLIRWDLWQPGLAIVDVTNPQARKWYAAKLSTLVDLGVDAFKVSDWENPPPSPNG